MSSITDAETMAMALDKRAAERVKSKATDELRAAAALLRQLADEIRRLRGGV